MFCSQCGNQLQPSDKFCRHCGTKVPSSSDPVSDPTAVSSAGAPSVPKPAPLASSESTHAQSAPQLDETFIHLVIDAQPFLLPLEKIELIIDGVVYPKTFKLGDQEKIKVSAGAHQLQATLKIPLLKRRADPIEVVVNPNSVKKVMIDYNNITGGISFVV